MRIFITGASGYVGSVVCEKALKAGHEVVGLARSDASEKKLKDLGVTPLSGTLQDTNLLKEAASKSEAVLHLGFVHEFDRPYDELIAIDIAAIKVMGEGLRGSGKALIATSGTGVVLPNSGKTTNEDSPVDPQNLRVSAEKAATDLAESGVKGMVIRLSPHVYGRGGSYFVPMSIQGAAQAGFAGYVGKGEIMTSAADVDCAAELYLLAMEKGKAGEVYICTTEDDLRTEDLAGAVGKVLSLPVKSLDMQQLSEVVGPFVARFGYSENRASSEKAREQLGWKPQPKHKLVDDIVHGSYREMANGLKSKIAATK